ncbi:MAG: hypothetical protein AAF730_14135 [Bacteroidota bacterium]
MRAGGDSGRHPFEATDLPSGTYLARLTADGRTLTHPIALVR